MNNIVSGIAIGALLLSTPALADQSPMYPEPVITVVTSVVDGDTIHVVGPFGKDHTVRLLGIDAAEMHGKCSDEIELAHKTKDMLSGMLFGKQVVLTNVRKNTDRYGRTLARPIVDGCTDVALELLKSGLVRPYDGGKRDPWCDNHRN